MEMEVMEARLIRASELNGEMDDDDTGQWQNRHAADSVFTASFLCWMVVNPNTSSSLITNLYWFVVHSQYELYTHRVQFIVNSSNSLQNSQCEFFRGGAGSVGWCPVDALTKAKKNQMWRSTLEMDPFKVKDEFRILFQKPCRQAASYLCAIQTLWMQNWFF